MLTEVHVPVEHGTLKLYEPLFAPQGEARIFRLHANVSGLAFKAAAETHGDGYPLRQFLNDLARDWSGWEGERHWYDGAVKLRIWATHDRRRLVTFTLQYRSDQADAVDGAEPLPAGEWKVAVSFAIEPGRLQNLAEDVARLFSASNNPG
jgi:hypothetical protein